MESELSIEIDRPIAEVFECANDHITEWSLTCVEEETLEEKPGGVGTTFRMVTQDRGKLMEFRGVVTKWGPPHLSAVELVGDHFDIDVDYRLEDLSGRTRLTQHSDVKGKGFVKVLFFLFGWLFQKSGCKAQENELESLKTFCEDRPVNTPI